MHKGLHQQQRYNNEDTNAHIGDDKDLTEASNTTLQHAANLAKHLAGSVGFSACGICRTDPIERSKYVGDWLQAGCHGQMTYLERNLDVRLDPGRLLAGAKTVIVVAWLYRVRETPTGGPYRLQEPQKGSQPDSPDTPQTARSARIARYAWGRDYHRVIGNRLRKMVDQLHDGLSVPFESRICVDTAPLLERELAQRAGIGWIGNNCVVMNRPLGSYFSLGAVLTTLDLPPDPPATDFCGTCRRCLEACPTGALVAPKRMDARRCISYQTIEMRTDDTPQDLTGQIFGCDICQEVCPYNGPRAAVSIDPDSEPRRPAGRIDPRSIICWTPADWDIQTRGRALRRATLQVWHRNAASLMDDLQT